MSRQFVTVTDDYLRALQNRQWQKRCDHPERHTGHNHLRRCFPHHAQHRRNISHCQEPFTPTRGSFCNVLLFAGALPSTKPLTTETTPLPWASLYVPRWCHSIPGPTCCQRCFYLGLFFRSFCFSS